MEFTQYFLALIVCFAGLVAGAVIAFFVKEELADRTWFVWMQKILLVSMLVLFVNLFGFSILARVAFYLVILAIAALNLNFIIYPVLGVIFYFSANSSLFIAVSGLIFLYSLPTGSLLSRDSKYNAAGITKKTIFCLGFMLLALLLQILMPR